MQKSALDIAFEEMVADGDDEAQRLRFYGAVADAELWLLLESEAEGDQIKPKLIDTGEGRFALAFDSEERLAEFAQLVVPHAALPGRALIQMLKGQSLGLGINLGVAPSETLIAADIVDWLAEQFDDRPKAYDVTRPTGFFAPRDLPAGLIARIDARLARAAGLATQAYLVGTIDREGLSGMLLALVGVVPGAEAALAKSVAECVQFFAEEGTELHLAFLVPDDPMIGQFKPVAHVIEIPEPKAPEAPVRPPPGSDPNNPPRLH